MNPDDSRPMLDHQPTRSKVGSSVFEVANGGRIDMAAITIDGSDLDGRGYVKLEADMLLYRQSPAQETFINIGYYFRMLPDLLRELYELRKFRSEVTPLLEAAYRDPVAHIERVESVKTIQRWWRYHSLRRVASRHWRDTVGSTHPVAAQSRRQ